MVTISSIIQASNSDDNYVALGERYRSGHKYLGWAWRAINAAGEIDAIVTSGSYERLAKETPINDPVLSETNATGSSGNQ